ncbi:hypothetical protein ATANTOWER_012459 [Ataeniobius toweri]|uniref:Uncharacterized protein n=1 Tax=Ataeniobius toweri TaxID=208326 RepID=A0ABU7BFA6_9TELE|nr:hypothetical protein [Ataeniobius toweri]
MPAVSWRFSPCHEFCFPWVSLYEPSDMILSHMQIYTFGICLRRQVYCVNMYSMSAWYFCSDSVTVSWLLRRCCFPRKVFAAREICCTVKDGERGLRKQQCCAR